MCHHLLFLTVIAATLASAPKRQPLEEKSQSPKRSAFFRSFDPGRVLAKHVEVMKKTGKPWGSGSRRGLMVSYPPVIKEPGDSMSDFHLEGEISEKQLKEMLASIKSELVELARGKVTIISPPSDRIGARPIIWFHAILGPNWLDLGHFRGYYFTYRQGNIEGTVDILAAHTDPHNAKQWMIACAVHERERKNQKGQLVSRENPKDGATMLLLRAGEVSMGSDADEVDDHFRRFGYQKDWKKYALPEIPRHRQAVKSFFLYKFEVTNAQYQKFVAETGHAPPPYWKGKVSPAGKEKHPVVEVSWHDAEAYCRWAGTRLPTEAEWEYAARGPAPAENKAPRIFPWGDQWDRSRANSASYHAGKDLVDNQAYAVWSKGIDPASVPLTTPVGSFPKGVSPFGVQDMAGNAWEWCADPYAPYHGSPAGAPPANKKVHAARGGSWANVSFHLRCSDRRLFDADTRNLYVGFRCARDRKSED